jgi:hypothetical protein
LPTSEPAVDDRRKQSGDRDDRADNDKPFPMGHALLFHGQPRLPQAKRP